MTGVWLVFDYDHVPYAISVHAEELDAHRAASSHGYGRVCFWPFGAELNDAVKAAS